jgi:hypothetical protein
VKHSHPADPVTVDEILDCVETERRLLEEYDPNDYEYSGGGKEGN